ncbi:MAG: ankyrin repeat domain-containing protein, partial [Comamonadaceae bacterium]
MKRERVSEGQLDALIQSEGTVDFRDSDGCTPLLTACESYRWALENLFYATQDDEDDDEEDDEGDDEQSREEAKAQELAEAQEELAMHAFNLQAVLRRQPNMAARARDGSDALSFAAASGNAEFVDLLLSHGAQVNADTFGAAVNSLAIDAVRKLAEQHAHLAGPNLLLFACNSTSDKPYKLEMVQYLVEHLHADVNARAARSLWCLQGRVRRQGTPLMAAALTDDLPVAEYLLSAGADVHAVDVYGNTALHYCSGATWIAGDTDAVWFAGEDNPQVVALLRQHGADDAARNAAGRTPADLAAAALAGGGRRRRRGAHAAITAPTAPTAQPAR